MNLFKDPFKDDQSLANFEIIMLRAYVLFEIATKLMVLSVAHLRDAAHQLGLV